MEGLEVKDFSEHEGRDSGTKTGSVFLNFY